MDKPTREEFGTLLQTLFPSVRFVSEKHGMLVIAPTAGSAISVSAAALHAGLNAKGIEQHGQHSFVVRIVGFSRKPNPKESE